MTVEPLNEKDLGHWDESDATYRPERLKELFTELKRRTHNSVLGQPFENYEELWQDVEELFGPLVRK